MFGKYQKGNNNDEFSELIQRLNNDKEFYNEFVLEFIGDAKKLNKALEKKGYLGGEVIDNNKLLLCATEMRTQDEIDDFVNITKGFMGE